MAQNKIATKQWLVFSREEQVIIEELVKILPKPPLPGLDKQQVLDAMGWKGYSVVKREEQWRKIYNVVLKSRRMFEERQPDRPIIVNTGTRASEPRYQLVGWTWHDGTPAIFDVPIQLSQMLETRLMPEFRTRATAISELLSLNYLVAITDAYDKGDKKKASQIIRLMSKNTLVIVPIFSLMGQLMGIRYQQARSIPELMQTWTNAIQDNPQHGLLLRRPLSYLRKALKKDWPHVEDALVALLEQLVPALLLYHGTGTMRQALDTRAQQITRQVLLPPGNP